MSLPAVLQGRVRTLGGGEEPACGKAALRRSQAGLPGPAGRACQAVRRLVGLQKLLPPLQDARREEETRRREQRHVKCLPSPTALPSGPRPPIRGRFARNAAHTGKVTGKSVRFSPAQPPLLGRRQDTPCAAKSAASTKSDGILPRPTLLFGRKNGENKHKTAQKVTQPSVQGLQTFCRAAAKKTTLAAGQMDRKRLKTARQLPGFAAKRAGGDTASTAYLHTLLTEQFVHQPHDSDERAASRRMFMGKTPTRQGQPPRLPCPSARDLLYE